MQEPLTRSSSSHEILPLGREGVSSMNPRSTGCQLLMVLVVVSIVFVVVLLIWYTSTMNDQQSVCALRMKDVLRSAQMYEADFHAQSVQPQDLWWTSGYYTGVNGLPRCSEFLGVGSGWGFNLRVRQLTGQPNSKIYVWDGENLPVKPDPNKIFPQDWPPKWVSFPHWGGNNTNVGWVDGHVYPFDRYHAPYGF